jgi:uncharacterized membrane protein
MFKVSRNIHIEAPVEKVFAFLEDKTHLPEIWPSMIEVGDEETLESGGKRFHWVYKMAGMKFEGTTEETEFERNKRILGVSKKAIENEMAWTFDSHNGGTEVTFEATYHVPVPLVGKIAEPLLAKMNEGEADLVLANLKARLEG